MIYWPFQYNCNVANVVNHFKSNNRFELCIHQSFCCRKRTSLPAVITAYVYSIHASTVGHDPNLRQQTPENLYCIDTNTTYRFCNSTSLCDAGRMFHRRTKRRVLLLYDLCSIYHYYSRSTAYTTARPPWRRGRCRHHVVGPRRDENGGRTATQGTGTYCARCASAQIERGSFPDRAGSGYCMVVIVFFLFFFTPAPLFLEHVKKKKN